MDNPFWQHHEKNRIAERLAVMETRQNSYDDTGERVGKLETKIEGITIRLNDIATDVTEIRGDRRHLIAAIDDIREANNRIDRQLAKVAGHLAGAVMLATVLAATINVITNFLNMGRVVEGVATEVSEDIERTANQVRKELEVDIEEANSEEHQ